VLPTTGWAQRVHFPNTNDGLIMDLIGDSSGNLVQYTTDGGAGATDWTNVVDNTDGGWFGLQFSELPTCTPVLPELISAAARTAARTGAAALVDSVFRRTCFLPE